MDNLQLPIFYDHQAMLSRSGLYRKYDAIFSALDLSGLPDTNTGPGRPGYSRHAILRALIFKHMEEIKSVPRLVQYLLDHPVVAGICGFPFDMLPEESQFYRFLEETPNGILQDLHVAANCELIDKKVIKLDQFIADSKPVKAATRHNNPKNPSRSRDKNKKIRRNPDATLGYYSYVDKSDGTKRIEFFWGYRTHVIVSK